MTQPIEALRDRHAGETCYIVGRGPSLLSVTPEHFGPGPVITLNLAILEIRKLDLPNQLYVQQKDGCRVHDEPNRHCGGPCVAVPGRLTPPIPPEVLLMHTRESPFCFEDYPDRYLFDVELDFAGEWYNPSAPVAVQIARLMGCTSLVMLCHDAYTSGEFRRVEPGQGLVYEPVNQGYVTNGAMAAEAAGDLPVRWVTPA